jgi:hypothetical protein
METTYSIAGAPGLSARSLTQIGWMLVSVRLTLLDRGPPIEPPGFDRQTRLQNGGRLSSQRALPYSHAIPSSSSFVAEE